MKKKKKKTWENDFQTPFFLPSIISMFGCLLHNKKHFILFYYLFIYFRTMFFM